MRQSHTCFHKQWKFENRLEYAYGKILFRLVTCLKIMCFFGNIWSKTIERTQKRSDFEEFNFVNEPFWRVSQNLISRFTLKIAKLNSANISSAKISSLKVLAALLQIARTFQSREQRTPSMIFRLSSMLVTM